LLHKLPVYPDNVHWGYYDARLAPVLKIKPGDLVDVETVSGNPEDLDGLLDIAYRESPALKEVHTNVKRRGPGAHILTGPIEVEGAMSGDVLEVKLVEIEPMTSFGFCQIIPMLGALPEEFPYAKTKLV
jgi:acetamidase/formamidase